jgi:hypothetical protein
MLEPSYEPNDLERKATTLFGKFFRFVTDKLDAWIRSIPKLAGGYNRMENAVERFFEKVKDIFNTD